MGGQGGFAGIRSDFETSLHNTRAGQEFWYRDTNGGFQGLVNVPYGDLTCQGCHNPMDPDWEGLPSCADCHGDFSGDKHLQADTCLGCHSRQGAERTRLFADGMRADIHVDSTDPILAVKDCASCHGLINGATDVHGDGNTYDSMLRPGAIVSRCEDCHDGVTAPAPDPTKGVHKPFGGEAHAPLDCALCHTETVVSCINCHFDTEVDQGQKCAAFQVFDWKFVMKWDKEGDGNEKYHPATIMTLKYNCARPKDPTDPFADCSDPTDPYKTFAAFAPYYAHTVTRKAMDDIKAAGPGPFTGQEGCGYCHGGPTSGPAVCDDILAADPTDPDNKLKLIEWTASGLTNPVSGLIPLPPNYKDLFAVDFAEFEAGAGVSCLDTSDPTDPQPRPLVFFETGPDLWQTGEDYPVQPADREELGHPLSQAEFDRFCPAP